MSIGDSIQEDRGMQMNRHAALKAAMGLFAGVGLTVSAHAQVLKDPLPDSFTLAGVTLYGTVGLTRASPSQAFGVRFSL